MLRPASTGSRRSTSAASPTAPRSSGPWPRRSGERRTSTSKILTATSSPSAAAPAQAEALVYRVLTELTVAVHFAFLVFVVAGGWLARRHRWIAIPHLLAAAWGVYVEAMPGILCPLTPLENLFALRAGEA